MSTLARAKVIVSCRSSEEEWRKAIDLVLTAMRNGKLEWRDVGFTDSVEQALASGHFVNNQHITFMNKALSLAGISSLD